MKNNDIRGETYAQLKDALKFYQELRVMICITAGFLSKKSEF